MAFLRFLFSAEFGLISSYLVALCQANREKRRKRFVVMKNINKCFVLNWANTGLILIIVVFNDFDKVFSRLLRLRRPCTFWCRGVFTNRQPICREHRCENVRRVALLAQDQTDIDGFYSYHGSQQCSRVIPRLGIFMVARPCSLRLHL